MSEPIEVWGVELTVERARQVRAWRVDKGETWRGVAGRADCLWGSDSSSNQLFGEDLCGAAARLLGEDPNKEPWN